MTTIFYETSPVANLIDRDGISLAYEPIWEHRASAFPISLTMPLRFGIYGAEQVMPWLANLLPDQVGHCRRGFGLAGIHIRVYYPGNEER
ncbi:HipA N-terminal domain-containing protein [Ensifer oleiphilus]|uniref:HipA N-terminal domain-containing protein n=1 Tax=Ensifer oleiphilus TaxID=2742698 RepID=UPI0031B83918